nr:Lrp/AsnC family transcriptional regulator [Poseidonocella pacifica]
MQLDELDTALIGLLADDARAPIADLARRLGVARTTVQARIDRLEQTGTIAGYTLRIGADAKHRIRATALVSVEPRTGTAVVSRLSALPQVQIVHTASGRFDLIVEIASDETDSLDEALDQISAIKGVTAAETLVHLSTKVDRTH